MLAGIAAALRPGGVYLCVDTSASSELAENMGHPLAPFLYTVSCMHCMTVSLAYGGAGLGAEFEDGVDQRAFDQDEDELRPVHRREVERQIKTGERERNDIARRSAGFFDPKQFARAPSQVSFG